MQAHAAIRSDMHSGSVQPGHSASCVQCRKARANSFNGRAHAAPPPRSAARRAVMGCGDHAHRRKPPARGHRARWAAGRARPVRPRKAAAPRRAVAPPCLRATGPAVGSPPGRGREQRMHPVDGCSAGGGHHLDRAMGRGRGQAASMHHTVHLAQQRRQCDGPDQQPGQSQPRFGTAPRNASREAGAGEWRLGSLKGMDESGADQAAQSVCANWRGRFQHPVTKTGDCSQQCTAGNAALNAHGACRRTCPAPGPCSRPAAACGIAHGHALPPDTVRWPRGPWPSSGGAPCRHGHGHPVAPGHPVPWRPPGSWHGHGLGRDRAPGPQRPERQRPGSGKRNGRGKSHARS